MAIDILPPFADAEEVLRIYLRTKVSAATRIVSATGPELIPPTILLRRIGGYCDRITDFATIYLSCIEATRPKSIVLAAQVQAYLLNATNTAVVLTPTVTALIDGIDVDVADHPEAYENPDVRQVSATFELRMRRPLLSA